MAADSNSFRAVLAARCAGVLLDLQSCITPDERARERADYSARLSQARGGAVAWVHPYHTIYTLRTHTRDVCKSEAERRGGGGHHKNDRLEGQER